MDESTVDQDATPGLSCFVDVFDRADLFDRIDNPTVVRLSCLGQKSGFASVDSVQKSTGISLRRMLKPVVTALDLAIAVLQLALACDSHNSSARLRVVAVNALNEALGARPMFDRARRVRAISR